MSSNVSLRRVNGLDATAARTFGTLCASLGARGIEMIITHVPKKQMRKLMRSHGIILPDAELEEGEKPPGSTAREFRTMEAGIQYCEEQFLQVDSLWLDLPSCLSESTTPLSSHRDGQILPHGAAFELMNC